MNLAEIRLHTIALLDVAGETKLPDLPVYAPLLQECLMDIAGRAYVLGLLTKSSDFQVLREIESGVYIRTPKKAIAEIDDVDIDQELTYAASNLVAAKVARDPMNKQMFKSDGDEIIDAYNFKVYRTLKLREEEECDV